MFKEGLNTHLYPGEIESMNNMSDACSMLVTKNCIRHGEYDFLQKLFNRIEHMTCYKIVVEFSRKIEDMKLQIESTEEVSVIYERQTEAHPLSASLSAKITIEDKDPPDRNEETIFQKIEKNYSNALDAINIERIPPGEKLKLLKEWNETLKHSIETTEMLLALKDKHISASRAKHGCLNITFTCTESVMDLWNLYISGELTNILQHGLITKYVLEECHCDYIKLAVFISKEDYIYCLKKVRTEPRQNDIKALLQLRPRTLAQAKRNISKSKDIREEMSLVVAPTYNWQEYLLPVPTVIACLGELMFISTVYDFTLSQPKAGFRHILQPYSFRVSLVQVAIEGKTALTEAHKSMNAIFNETKSVRYNLKQAVTILMQKTDKEVKDLLSNHLNAISKTAETCFQLATSVEQQFEHVTELTTELMEALEAESRGLEESEITLHISEENEPATHRQKEMAENLYSELEKAVDNVETRYFQSIDLLPKGITRIVLKTMEALTTSFTNIITSGIARTRFGEMSIEHSDKTEFEDHDRAINEKPAMYYNVAPLIHECIHGLATFLFNNGDINLNALQRSDVVSYFRKNLTNITQGTRGAESPNPVRDKMTSLCDRGIDICDELYALAKEADCGDTALLKSKLFQLQKDSLAFLSESKIVQGAGPTEFKPPQISKWKPDDDIENAIQSTTTQSFRYKIETSIAHLDYLRSRHEKACDRLIESSQNLSDFMNEMAQENGDIKLESIEKKLLQILKCMGQMKEKWQMLIKTFKMMADIINCCTNSTLVKFESTVNNISTMKENPGLYQYPITSLQRDMMYSQVFGACQIAILVNTVSEMYVQVSNECTMTPLSQLGEITWLGHETKHDAVQNQRILHLQTCKEAQQRMKVLVVRRKRYQYRKIENRKMVIRHTLEAALPKPTVKELEDANSFKESLEKYLLNIKTTEMGAE